MAKHRLIRCVNVFKDVKVFKWDDKDKWSHTLELRIGWGTAGEQWNQFDTFVQKTSISSSVPQGMGSQCSWYPPGTIEHSFWFSLHPTDCFSSLHIQLWQSFVSHVYCLSGDLHRSTSFTWTTNELTLWQFLSL